MNLGDPDDPALHPGITHLPDAMFCDIDCMVPKVIFGSDLKMGSKSSFDLTDNSANSLGCFRLISGATRLNEKQRWTVRR